MTICIVDDHPLMREALAMVMSRLRPDMPVVELGRLRDLDLLKDSAERPTVIFLDLNLPDARGWSGVSQVKISFPAVPLAVYSASPALDMERGCLEAGANLYVEKTVDIKSLAIALDSLLFQSRVLDTCHRRGLPVPPSTHIVTRHDHL